MNHIKRKDVRLTSGLYIPATGKLWVPEDLKEELDRDDRSKLEGWSTSGGGDVFTTSSFFWSDNLMKEVRLYNYPKRSSYGS